jgi:hypothetical protein
MYTKIVSKDNPIILTDTQDLHLAFSSSTSGVYLLLSSLLPFTASLPAFSLPLTVSCSTPSPHSPRYVLQPDEHIVEMKATDVLAKPPFMSLVALVAILDPPRDEAIAAVKVAHKAGIEVKMITGKLRIVGRRGQCEVLSCHQHLCYVWWGGDVLRCQSIIMMLSSVPICCRVGR